MGDSGGKGEGGALKAFSGLLEAGASLVKVGALAAIVGVVVWDWPSFRGILEDATSFEFGGLKVNREVAFAAVDRLVGEKKDTNIEWAQGAVIRALRNAKAVNGSRILWVDDMPENQNQERAVLQTIGITVDLARSTDQAMDRIMSAPDRYQLIISDIRRLPLEQPAVAPSNCRVQYSRFPSPAEEAEYGNDLVAFNAVQNREAQGGFALAERLSADAKAYVDIARSRLIYYTLTSADGAVLAPCARLVTNRAAVLLNEVVSALEEMNWQALERRPAK